MDDMATSDDTTKGEFSQLMAMQVAPIELPEFIVQQLQQETEKKDARPNPTDKLQTLADLRTDHLEETTENEQAGHQRLEKDIEGALLKRVPVRSAPARGSQSARAATNLRKAGFSPVDAARAATNAKVAAAVGRSGRRRRGDRSEPPPLPTHRQINEGWKSLLGEIALSTRRVRLARGGHLPHSLRGGAGTENPASGSDSEGEGAPRAASSPSATSPRMGEEAGDKTRPGTGRSRASTPREGPRQADTEEKDEDIWISYRINPEKVPDSMLSALWRHAVDPKSAGEVQPLEKVPRLTVTKREVQPLPAVNDIVQWRQTNKRRREQRKARRDAERNPTLEEMLVTLFGEPDPDGLVMNEAKLRKRAAVAAVAAAIEEITSPEVVEQASALQRQALQEELELLQEVDALLGQDEEEMMHDIEKEHTLRGPRSAGFQRRGRRCAFNEGRTVVKATVGAGAEDKKNQVRSARLQKGLEHLRVLSNLSVDKHPEELAVRHLEKVDAACASVGARCEARVKRLHNDFLRRQGQLSDRLGRRVKRMQLDHPEIHDMKTRSILPSVVAGPEDREGKSAKPHSVLHYLKPHRISVERERQGKHAVYMRQVKKFQHSLRCIADPNRTPERGEIYLSQCFRHVLAAGLAVDRAYFFRVLEQMESEDFERVFTVNLLAACIDAFEIPIREYVAFLESYGFPCWAPTPLRTKEDRLGTDTDAWDGVEMVPLVLEKLSKEEQSDLDGVPILEDPLPMCPVLKPETPRTSELASRDDPLRDILEAGSFDCPLTRYHIGRSQQKTAPPDFMGLLSALKIVSDDMMEEERKQAIVAAARKDSMSSAPHGEISAPMPTDQAHEAVDFPATPRQPRPPIQIASPPVTRRGATKLPIRGSRPFVPNGHATLRSTRWVAEPIKEIAAKKTTPSATTKRLSNFAGKHWLHVVQEHQDIDDM